MRARCATCGAPSTLIDVTCRYCRTPLELKPVVRWPAVASAGFMTVNEIRRAEGLAS